MNLGRYYNQNNMITTTGWYKESIRVPDGNLGIVLMILASKMLKFSLGVVQGRGRLKNTPEIDRKVRSWTALKI